MVRQIAERLVLRGHEVTVATTSLHERDYEVLNGVQLVGFSVTGNAVEGMDGDVAGYNVLWWRANSMSCWFMPRSNGPLMPCGR